MLYNNKFVKSLPYTFNMNELVDAYYDLIKIKPIDKKTNQLCLTHRKNADNPWYDGNGSYFATKTDGTLDLENRLLYEADFTEFNEEIKHTYFYEIYKTISQYYTLGRVRIMSIPFKKGLSWHRDLEYRIHLPIISNIGSFMVFEDRDNMIAKDVPSYYTAHYPANGTAVIIDPRKHHTAFNGDRETRINLLLDVVSDINGITEGLL